MRIMTSVRLSFFVELPIELNSYLISNAPNCLERPQAPIKMYKILVQWYLCLVLEL